MDPNTFPTKGNLILAKNSLALSLQGFDLMDKKRNILIREMMNLIDEAKGIQSQIDVTFREAYGALQRANMEIGINTVQTISYTVPIEDSIRIKTRSIMVRRFRWWNRNLPGMLRRMRFTAQRNLWMRQSKRLRR